MHSTHSTIPRDLPKPPPLVEVWGDLRFENATKGSWDRLIATLALFQRGACLLAAPGGILTRLACKNNVEISTSEPAVGGGLIGCCGLCPVCGVCGYWVGRGVGVGIDITFVWFFTPNSISLWPPFYDFAKRWSQRIPPNSLNSSKFMQYLAVFPFFLKTPIL